MEAMHATTNRNPFPRLAVLLLLVAIAAAQPLPVAPPPEDAGCNGVLLTYTFEGRERIRPFLDPTTEADSQPYSFRANATVLNSGVRTLPSWALLLTFIHGEILVGVDGAVLTSGADLPYNTTAAPTTTTSFSGYPQTDLLTPIATAGDLSKIQATVRLYGTLFAGPEPLLPLPSALSLSDPAYNCSPLAPAPTTTRSTCCVLKSPDQLAAEAPAGSAAASYLPRVAGDLVITYDVLQAHESTYLALLTLENDAPMGRLDGWELSWEWQRGEFVNTMRGAYPRKVDASECLFGPQGQYYKDIDFSKVLNCERRPAVFDLPPERRQDASMGQIEHCCRNGTLLPKSMGDGTQSVSAFQMEVYKMPPDVNRTSRLHAPANFRVTGASTLNPEHACGQPVPVSPSEFPDPSGLDSTTLAVASWQVSCNITVDDTSKPSKPPQCCVSFSSFNDESVVPCNTCACGCPAPATRTCSATAPAMVLPPYALLMPFERRDKEALKWAHDKELGAPPDPLPCGDMCGVSVNWHLATDAAGGWSARITLFNWEDSDMRDWFASVVLDDKVYGGFEQAYSFNATAAGDGTIFMRGREGFDVLIRESNMSGVDYPVPGKQQSVLSFTKKTSPADVDVLRRDGFPTKVFFNGEECAMPNRIPSHGGIGARASRAALLLLLSLFYLLVSSA
ncbi:COBRA-like protein 7 [Lolium perenne]|uniref:COBRA-like protein 7 n=1 Tax=Lolium perenne TaxID=4522 RepID=UPI0021EA2447|nr:COBRA-like protein 7 [Lolium perenne]